VSDIARRNKRRWSDLSGPQKAGVITAGAIQLTLQAAALVDLRRRPADRIKGSKAAWAAASFVNTLGPIAYFAFGRRR
jgi:hypothetical protein